MEHKIQTLISLLDDTNRAVQALDAVIGLLSDREESETTDLCALLSLIQVSLQRSLNDIGSVIKTI